MNENNNSKARVYSLFAVALLLMGIGLFGGFYTLMGGINTGKLVGKTSCTYAAPIVSCPSGYSLDRNGYYGGRCYATTSIKNDWSRRNGYCPTGYTLSRTRNVCYKTADAVTSCPNGYSSYKSQCVKCTQVYEPTPTTTTTTKAPLKNISLNCKTKDGKTLKDGSTITVYRPVTCTVNTNGVKFKATGKKAVTLTGSKKKYSFSYIKSKETATIKVSKSGYKTKTIKFKVTDDMKITSNSKKAFKIYCPTKVRVGDKFICYVSEEYRGAVINTTFNKEKPVEAKKNTKILYLKYDKPGSLVVSAKYGKKPYSRTVNVIDKEASKKTKVHLNCSRTEVKANEKFYCFSRIDGVQIKIDSKCKLNSGFNNTMTTSFANNTRKYANYFSCSKGDNTIVTVTATKDGYVSNSKTINIK